jgi:pimeloyl-CoA synthetase
MDDEVALASVNTLTQKGGFRENVVLEQLRMMRLNSEKKAYIRKICFDYQDYQVIRQVVPTP